MTFRVARPKYLDIVSVFIIVGLASCGVAYEQRTYCGESFCVRGKAKLTSKHSPIEDFNTYNILIDELPVMIYEGNHPRSLNHTTISTLKGNFDPRSVEISRSQQRIEARIATGMQPWPNYLEISFECPGDGLCDIASVVGRIIPK